MLRNRRMRGISMVSLGIGILLAMLLPVHLFICFAGIALIILGCTWMKRC